MTIPLDTPRGKSGRIDENTQTFLPDLNVINSDNTKVQSPMQITQPTTPTQATGLAGAIDVQQDGFVKALDAKAAEAKKVADSNTTALIDRMFNTKGEVALTDKAYQAEVDPAEAELRDINQEILQEKESTRRRIEAIRKNPGGLFGGALEDKVNEIERESVSKQADLSVIQLAKQGKYDSAKAIADRGVAATLENERNTIEALKISYEDSKDLFDEDEQRAFEAAQNDRERVLNEKEDDMKAVKRLAIDYLKSGGDAGTAQQIMSSQDLKSATKLAGGVFKTGGTGTAGEREQGIVQQYQSRFVTGATLPNGIPVLDVNGYLTPEAFNVAISSGDLSRKTFLENFGYLLYRDKDNAISQRYKLTPQEMTIVVGK
jgi:hypothetical protein